jgi:phytoene dehydrogenase-like protein
MFLGLIGLLDYAFERISLNRKELLPLRKVTNTSSTTLPDGSVVTIGEDAHLMITGRAVDAPRLDAELRRMAEKWQPVVRFASEELLIHPFSSWRMLQKGWRHLSKLRGTVATECQSLFSDNGVRSALAGSLLYTGLPPEKMPIAAFLGLVASINEGLYVPEAGMGQIPEVLQCALAHRGASISLNSRVEKIVIEGGRVRAVQMRDGERIDASAVISTLSGMLTFGSLLDKEHVPPAVGRQLSSPPLSHRAVSVQLGLSNEIGAPAHSVSVLPWMENQHEVFEQDGRELKYPIYSIPTRTMPELAAHGGSVVEMFYPVRPDLPLDRWDATRKEQIAELCITALRRTHDIDPSVVRIRSPRDFRDTMHLFGGALYGLSPAATPSQQFAHSTPIPGLYMAGQTTFPGYGVGTSMMSGIFAAEALQEYLT